VKQKQRARRAKGAEAGSLSSPKVSLLRHFPVLAGTLLSVHVSLNQSAIQRERQQRVPIALNVPFARAADAWPLLALSGPQGMSAVMSANRGKADVLATFAKRREWPLADIKRCLLARLLSGVKRTRCARSEDFRFCPDRKSAQIHITFHLRQMPGRNLVSSYPANGSEVRPAKLRLYT
jgi:hypothetical protein